MKLRSRYLIATIIAAGLGVADAAYAWSQGFGVATSILTSLLFALGGYLLLKDVLKIPL